MQLKHSFTVPMPADEAFTVLRDIESIAPCMPGATITDVRGEEFDGTVKVKVGPMQVTYRGTARFTAVDEAARTAVIEARGRETRGPGTAQATISAALHERGSDTNVEVTTDLAVTGRPAQFGRGVMAEVGEKLLGQFATCLATHLGGSPDQAGAASEDASGAEESAATAAGAEPVAATDSSQGGEPVDDSALPPAPAPGSAALGVTTPATPAQPTGAGERPTSDTIDLFDVARAPVMKRLAPVLLLLFVVGVLVRLRRARAARSEARRKESRRGAGRLPGLSPRSTAGLRGR